MSLSAVEEAIQAGDAESYTRAFNQYDSHIDSLNEHVVTLNNHFGYTDYSWLAWPFWIAFIFSFVLFIKSRGSPILPADQLRKQF